MKINHFGLIYFNFLVSVVCALTISAHVFYLVTETQYPNPRIASWALFIFGFFLWQLLTRYKEQEGHGFAFYYRNRDNWLVVFLPFLGSEDTPMV